MVTDASAILTVLAREVDADEFVDTLAAASLRLAPAIWVCETVAGLANQYTISILVTRRKVAEFIRVAEIEIAPIGESELELALDAHDKATPRIERCTSVWSCMSADFDPGLDTRTHGAAGPEKPSAFVRTRNRAVDYLLIQYGEAFLCHRMRRGARVGFPPNSLLIPCSREKFPAVAKKFPALST
jgi:hypothetical protein